MLSWTKRLFLPPSRPLGSLRHATQRNATQRNATQRNATQRNATQCNATQRNATQRNATQRNATQRNTTQYNSTQRNATILTFLRLFFVKEQEKVKVPEKDKSKESERGDCHEGCSGSLLGNKYCNPSCNNPECAFDGGDCGAQKVFELFGTNATKRSSINAVSTCFFCCFALFCFVLFCFV